MREEAEEKRQRRQRQARREDEGFIMALARSMVGEGGVDEMDGDDVADLAAI